MKIYTKQAQEAIDALLEVAKLEAEEIVIIGCSTSEVAGKRIGSSSSLEIARAIMEGLLPATQRDGLFMAVQCCEHLNRALVVEKKCAKKYFLEVVAAVPHEKAGGSLPTVAMNMFADPVLVETISGHAGIDIGDTFIGMHLKRVAVPVRLDIKNIGRAHLTFARTRPKYIGGERTCYK